MKLLIGIATYKRIEKLKRLLASLEKQTYDNFIIHIVCDNNDIDTFKYITSLTEYKLGHIGCSINKEHKFVSGAWNYVVQNYINTYINFDGFIGLCDDVELKPDALQNIVNTHQVCFPDTDGVCGFKQECPGHQEYTFKWFGQTLMGRKFIERYKEANYQICCPDYYHFIQDQEMYEFAKSLGSFGICSSAILNHYHPGYIKEETDETHNIIRNGNISPKKHDFEMQKKRKEKGYLWGRDFNLIGDNK